MIELLALLLSVSAADRADWPAVWEASRQYDRCTESIANLKKTRSLVGYEDGRWDLWVRQTEEDRDLWGILVTADSSELSDVAVCRRLLVYKRAVGPHAYSKRWHPPMAHVPYPDPTPRATPAHIAGND